MKINVDVQWSEKELNALLEAELSRHNLKPREGGFTWSVIDGADGKPEAHVAVQAEYKETYEIPPSRRPKQQVEPVFSLAVDPPVDLATLHKYVPKESIGPLTKAFEEAEGKPQRERLPGETVKRP